MFEEYKNQKFDIVVIMGQSNASGSGLGKKEDAYKPNPDIFTLNNSYTAEVKGTGYGNEYLDMKFSDDYYIEVAREDEKEGDLGYKGNLAYSFCEEYYKNDLEKDRKILIVKAAIGGTGFSKNHWGVGDVLYERTIKLTRMALDLNPQNRLVAFLWHQGEHDTFENAHFNDKERYDFYYAKLSAMLKGLRKEFGLVPFIAAGFTKYWINDYKNQCKAVYDATEKVFAENQDCAFIKDTLDLRCNNDILGNKDIVHFCKKDLYELGRRYYKTWKNMVK